MSIFFLFIFGLAIGSFLNVCIDRMPNDESINGRSHCDHCGKKLGPLDLVPVLSFILLGAKCRYCHKKLSFFYPFVEILTGLSFVFVWLFLSRVGPLYQGSDPFQTLPSILYLLSSLAIISSLIVIFFADLKYRIIPDQATIVLGVFAIPLVYLTNPTVQNLLSHIWAGLLLFGILAAIYYGAIFFMKKEGMGFGDVKLAFAMGLLLGVRNGLLALYLSFVLGGIISVFLILLGRKGMKSTVPFGPFLIMGTIAMLFWAAPINQLTLRFLGF